MKASRRHRPEIFAAARAHGHRFSLLFLVADHQLVGQLLQAMFPNFIGNFLVSQIRFGPKTGLTQAFRDAFGVVGLVLGDVQDHDLLRRQPEREGAARSARSGCR